MPNPKRFFILIFAGLISAGAYIAYSNGILDALAQSNFVQEVQSTISQSKIYNQTIRRQSADNIEFMSFLSKLNSDDFNQTSKIYSEINLDPALSDGETTRLQALKSIALTYARYEKLNTYVYKLVGEIQTASQAISESGFDTSNIDKEIETLTFSLSNIEANNAGIKYIMEKLNSNEVRAQEALEQVIRISNDSKLEYSKVFSELTSLLQR